MTLRVVLIDDNDAFRGVVRRVLESGGLQVIGEAATGATGIAVVTQLHPDLVILDVQLPDIDGFQVAGALSVAAINSAIVLVSTRSREDYGSSVAHSPARGFLTKSELSVPAVLDLLGR